LSEISLGIKSTISGLIQCSTRGRKTALSGIRRGVAAILAAWLPVGRFRRAGGHRGNAGAGFEGGQPEKISGWPIAPNYYLF